MIKLKQIGLLGVLCLGLNSLAVAEDVKPKVANAQQKSEVFTLETATLVGNQELPTVLYLVPWQPPTVQTLEADQTKNLLKYELETLDRTSFKRFIQYK